MTPLKKTRGKFEASGFQSESKLTTLLVDPIEMAGSKVSHYMLLPKVIVAWNTRSCNSLGAAALTGEV